MGARHKLNLAYFNGAVLGPVVAGLVTESWWCFAIVLLVCLVWSYRSGEIRPGGGRRHRLLLPPGIPVWIGPAHPRGGTGQFFPLTINVGRFTPASCLIRRRNDRFALPCRYGCTPCSFARGSSRAKHLIHIASTRPSPPHSRHLLTAAGVIKWFRGRTPPTS